MILDRLQEIPVFSGLSAEELAGLASATRELEVAVDQVVFRHGEAAEHAYFLLEGAITVFRDLLGRPMQLLARLTPGDWCGEMCLFGEEQRTVSARAVAPGRLLELPRHPVTELLARHPEVAVRLQITAARRKSEQAAATLDLGQQSEMRIRVAAVAELEGDGVPSRRVELHNLSPGGVSFAGAPTDWAQGEEVRLRLHVLDVVLERRARVAWRHQNQVGLAFLEVPADNEEVVRRLLRRLSAR